MAIELTKPEKDLLKAMLEEELENVRSEFHHAENFDYKESLKVREAMVRGLIDKIAG